MKNPFVIALVSALITAGAIKATPALAETPASEIRTYVSVVSTEGLDLTSSKGQRLLQHRLGQAARQVCGTASEVDVEGKNRVRNCRDEAIASATSQRDALLAAGTRGGTITLAAAH